MSFTEELQRFRRRQPDLCDIADDTITQYLEDSALEMPIFGISPSNPAYEKMLSLHAMHEMFVSGILKDVVSESVKDVSASYSAQEIKKAGSPYMAEFRKKLRRRKYPFHMMHNS